VTQALALKKAGNDIVNLLGGREIHPINVRVGGFYRIPSRKEFAALREKLEKVRGFAREAVRFVASLPFPDFERDYEFVALRHPSEYPFCEGRLASNKGLDIALKEYNDYFMEEHVEHSTSLQSVIKARGSYFTGPLARVNLNFDRLTPEAREAALEAGLEPPCRNPFKSIIARAVETLWAVDEALRILDTFEPPDAPYMKIEPRAGIGHGCTEAPRGILYHRYAVNANGAIEEAKIVPPTSQNQRCIEEDLRQYVGRFLDEPDDRLQWQCEQAVRNYDPCISCSTHFLRLRVEREGAR